MSARAWRCTLMAYYAVVGALYVVVVRFWSPPRWIALLVVLLAVAMGALAVGLLAQRHAVARSARKTAEPSPHALP